MSEASQLLNVGTEFEFEGRKYTMRPFNLADEAKFEAWVESRAYASVLRNRAQMAEDEFRTAMGEVAARSAAGEFDFFRPTCINAVQSPSGVKKIMLMTILDDGNPVDEEFVDKMYNAQLSGLVTALEALHSDPKAKAARRKAAKRLRQSGK